MIKIEENLVREKYKIITQTLIKMGRTITTMESATSGQIASLITDTEGSSSIFFGGLVTYSNDVKVKFGVPSNIIEQYGVYSTETAVAMAKTVRKSFDTDYAIGVTGTMGNVDPDNNDSVPGEVFFAIAKEEEVFEYHIEIEPLENRLLYKLAVAEKIADELLLIINNRA